MVSRQNLTGLLSRMEAQGIVERVVDPGDNRSRLIRLTEAGRVKWQELTVGEHTLQKLEFRDGPAELFARDGIGRGAVDGDVLTADADMGCEDRAERRGRATELEDDERLYLHGQARAAGLRGVDRP